jgi:bifunctional non-homologous end joining protein LigD
MSRTLPVVAPMLCALGKPEDVGRYSPDVWASDIKVDGWRILACKDDGAIRVMAGRNSANYSGQIPRVERALRAVLPEGTMVDGEIVKREGGSSGDVGSALTTNEPHEADDLVLVLFDLLWATGLDLRTMPYRNRRQLLEKVDVSPSQLQVSTLKQPCEGAFDEALNEGYEGLVLKRWGSAYTEGRSNAWVKCKAERSMECPIVNLPHDGKGHFEGLVGAVEFMLPNGTIGRASGMTLATRKDMTYRPERYLGRMAEFAYQFITDDGRMRHPRYKRMRPDRDLSTQGEEPWLATQQS